MQKSIISKKVRGRNRPRGVVIGYVQDQDLVIGYSLCNKQAGDTYDPAFGEELAIGRSTLAKKNYSIESAPTSKKLMSDGVPQSCIAGISELVSSLKTDKVTKVRIYTPKKQKTKRTPSKKVW